MWALLKSPLLVSADFDEVAKCKAHDCCWHLGCTHPRAPAMIVRAGPTDPEAPEKGSGAELIAVLQNTEGLAVSDDPLGMEAVRLEDAGGHSSPDVFLVSCHDIAGIWVAFFQGRQQHLCGQGRLGQRGGVAP